MAGVLYTFFLFEVAERVSDVVVIVGDPVFHCIDSGLRQPFHTILRDFREHGIDVVFQVQQFVMVLLADSAKFFALWVAKPMMMSSCRLRMKNLHMQYGFVTVLINQIFYRKPGGA